MDLEQLIRDLIENQGLTEDEATQVAAARLRVRRTAIAKSESAVARTGHGRNAHEESPEEALHRWREEEMQDPQGVYGGGASAGGVFGDGAILMSDFDPIAVSRTVQMQAQVANTHTQLQMLQLMQRMQAQLPPAPAPEPEPRRLGGFSRFLGRKKES